MREEIAKAIEPTAEEVFKRVEGMTFTEVALLSIAISSKRLADIAERQETREQEARDPRNFAARWTRP